jgi:sensor histidine kinase YesM
MVKIKQHTTLIIIAWWAAYSFLFASNLVGTADNSTGQAIEWTTALRTGFLGWFVWWTPISIGIFWVVERYPLGSGPLLKPFFILSGTVLAAVVLRGLYNYFIDIYNPFIQNQYSFKSLVATSLRINFMLLWMIIGIAHTFYYLNRGKERERHIAKIESRLVQAKLDALSAQLQPHFLFNALNSIAELVHHDPDKTDRMIVALSTMLRRSLSSIAEQVVTLQSEYNNAVDYLEIQKVRLGERLIVEWEIDQTCRDAYVPNFMLQPLIENAVIHAISKMQNPGTITISAHRENDQHRLTVTNDLPVHAEQTNGHGIGLTNIKERLKYLYGNEASLLNRQTVAHQNIVEIIIPFHRENYFDLTAKPE